METTSIVGRRMDRITADAVEALRFSGSAANANNALRTLRRMLHKAKEWKLIRVMPEFKLFKEDGRSLRLDDEAERKLLPVAEQPLKDIIVLMRDTGMRNVRGYKGKHIGAAFVNRQWVKARKAAGLPEDLVLYCARHNFGTYVMRKTGNLKAVMDAMGHSDVKIAMTYQPGIGDCESRDKFTAHRGKLKCVSC